MKALDTISTLLSHRAHTGPDAEAVRFQGESLSFAVLAERVGRLGSALRQRGVKPGDRVAVMLPNGLDYVVAWLGIPWIGAIAVPVDATYREADLAFVLDHAGVSFAIVGADQAPLVEAVRDRCPDLTAVGVLRADGEPSRFQHRIEAATPATLTATTPDTAASLQFTSGTTGFPKACVLDHRYWITVARAFQDALRLGAGDAILTAQRQSYMDPSWNLVLALLAGVPLIILPRFSASTFWESVRENGATFFYCIGTMPAYLMSQPPDPRLDRDHKVRLVYCSGIPRDMHDAIEERWGCPWREAYGTTELGAVLLARPEDGASVGSGHLGDSLPGREVRIVTGDGRDADPGEPGELRVRGVGLMQGYYDDPEATAAWMPDGWARTGDLVVRDDEGRYRLVGRLKDMIRRASENISAAEVEAVLSVHPAVRAVACIGVPDPLRGEEVKAYVELTADAPRTSEAAIHSFVLERLAPFKVPRYIEFVPSFPLTASEKIAKAALVASREDHTAGCWDAARGKEDAAP